MKVDRDRPNVILVVWDTARARNLSCYGHRRQTTPCLDTLASRAILYRRAISASPWTLPSHASLFTGLYPSQHGVHRRRSLSSVQAPVLAECLQRHGYQTAGFSCNTWISREFGFDRGFDHFFFGWQLVSGETDFFEVNRTIRQGGRPQAARLVAQTIMRGRPLRNLVNGLYSGLAFRYDKGAWLTQRQLRRWFRHDYSPRRPFFLFINYMEPHLPYKPPRAHGRRFLPTGVSEREVRSLNHDALAYAVGALKMDVRDFTLLESLYDAELRYLDDRFGELLDLLEEQGVLDNSLLVVTSDHGENIGDHGLMDHQYCLYDTLLHVPLIIRLPGSSGSCSVVEQMVEVKDIFFTVLDLLGMQREIDRLGLSGNSLLPDQLGKSQSRFGMAEYLEPQPRIEELRSRYPGFDCPQYDRWLRAIYSDDGYKFIWSSDDRHELYHLGRDPLETENQLDAYPEKAEELRGLLSANLPALAATPDDDADELAISKVIRRRLEGLGYL